PVVFLLLSCAPASYPYEGSYFAMDCRVKVTLNSEQSDLGEPQLEIGKIFSLYDSLADNNQRVKNHKNVYDINQTNEWVPVEKELYDLLRYSVWACEETQGYVNPLIGNLSDLWKDHLHPERVAGKEGEASVPSQEEIQACLDEMNDSSLRFEEETLSVRRIGTAKIDLGAIAKGYAAQKAKEWIEANQFKSYIVDAGTSTILLGEKDLKGSTWNVGIRGIGKKMNIKNTVVGSSGIDAQEAIIDGVEYSHIVNPFTGDARVDYFGVTLLGQDAAILDVLSTAFILMGVEENSDKVSALSEKYGVSYVFYRENEIVKNQGVPLE
ncbi:MAG: FAD:protein FMN transferase, partial [Bacilli bacterium]|nr:FAD:protein FMN transferase [Bacilli bacterium]